MVELIARGRASRGKIRFHSDRGKNPLKYMSEFPAINLLFGEDFRVPCVLSLISKSACNDHDKPKKSAT